jgi:hypothetical protein
VPASSDLIASYERPFRRAVVVTWRGHQSLRVYTGLSVALGVGGAVGALALSPLLWLVAATGVLFGVGTAIGWLGALARTGWRGRAGRRPGRGRPAELAAVRANRPQARSEDLRLGHDQFAVTVEEDGWLLTWRFRLLAVDGRPDVEEIEIPGRPRFAASPIEDARFDVRDAAVATEQLLRAQGRAAQREAAAAGATQAGIEDASEFAIEARSTAAALRAATGQREGRRGLRRRDR